MPITDPSKHVIPAGGEPLARANWPQLSASINDVKMVANATEQAQLLADLAAGTPAFVPTLARPLLVKRTDTGDYLEHDGAAWKLIGPSRGYYQSSGADVSGIVVPGENLNLNLDGRLMTKTGKNVFFTSASFGNEYAPTVNFQTAFPTACVAVSIIQIHTGDTFAYAGATAVDAVNAGAFRLLYPGGSAATKRGFLWTAWGY